MNSPHTSLSPLTFIGREDELGLLAGALRDPACPLVTVAGPGGVGKTRLAQQAAALHAQDFPQGVIFVPLASLVSPDYLIPAVAEALHFSFYAREDLGGQLLNYLREKCLLLILDSFEQVMAPPPLAVDWLAQVLRQAPAVKILLTSREQLGLASERAIVLQGMGLPAGHEGNDFDESPAVRLFLHNARLLNPFYEIAPVERSCVLRVCQLVGGLPLAIQMAAAWTRAISCEQIAREIERDMDFLRAPFLSAPERHQSLKVIFECSWRMLPYAERLVCRQLSVFRGSFSYDAAQQVTGATQEQLDTFVQKSLLQDDRPDAYRLHATLRQYAASRLAQDADEELQTRQRHAAYFRDFLQARQLHLKGRLQSQALHEIAAVIDDVRAAWQFSVQRDDLDMLAACAESLYLFLSVRSHSHEGLETFGQMVAHCNRLPACSLNMRVRWHNYQAVFAIELNDYALARQLLQQFSPAEMSLENRAFTYNLMARVAILSSDYAQAIDYGRKSLEMYEHLQDDWGRASVLDTLGVVGWTLGDYASAGQYFEQALAVYRQLGVQQGIASVLDHLGVVARDRGEPDRAQACFEESLSILRLLDARLKVAYAANHLGGVLAQMGDLPAAQTYFEEGISVGREIGELRIVAYTLADWGSFLGCQPQSGRRAQELFDEASSIFEKLGDLFGLNTVRLSQGQAALSCEDLPAALHLYQEALQIAVQLQNPRLINETLFGFVQFFQKQGDDRAAASLSAFLTSGAMQQIDELTSEKQALIDGVRSRLSPDDLSRALAFGQAQTLEAYLARLVEL